MAPHRSILKMPFSAPSTPTQKSSLNQFLTLTTPPVSPIKRVSWSPHHLVRVNETWHKDDYDRTSINTSRESPKLALDYGHTVYYTGDSNKAIEDAIDEKSVEEDHKVDEDYKVDEDSTVDEDNKVDEDDEMTEADLVAEANKQLNQKLVQHIDIAEERAPREPLNAIAEEDGEESDDYPLMSSYPRPHTPAPRRRVGDSDEDNSDADEAPDVYLPSLMSPGASSSSDGSEPTTPLTDDDDVDKALLFIADLERKKPSKGNKGKSSKKQACLDIPSSPSSSVSPSQATAHLVPATVTTRPKSSKYPTELSVSTKMPSGASAKPARIYTQRHKIPAAFQQGDDGNDGEQKPSASASPRVRIVNGRLRISKPKSVDYGCLDGF
ncbi:hypothetical protein K474DRAFT_1383026 [Panus rudis PR-1116 ss-1]|nr:hypothetical protein K474DRAFT_1383026 [Panus rudis PR-1116 ss-1]